METQSVHHAAYQAYLLLDSVLVNPLGSVGWAVTEFFATPQNSTVIAQKTLFVPHIVSGHSERPKRKGINGGTTDRKACQ